MEFSTYGGFENKSFSEVRQLLDEFEKNNPTAEIYQVETVGQGYDGAYDIYFCAYRYETDEEVSERLKKSKSEEVKKRQDRIEYLKEHLDMEVKNLNKEKVILNQNN